MTASQSCVSVVPLEQEQFFAAAPPVKAVYFFFSSFLPFTFPGICASALPYLFLFLTTETWIVLPIIAAVNKSKSLETGVSPHKTQLLPNYESIKTRRLPLSFPFQDGRQAKKNSDKKAPQLELVMSLLSFGFADERL